MIWSLTMTLGLVALAAVTDYLTARHVAATIRVAVVPVRVRPGRRELS